MCNQDFRSNARVSLHGLSLQLVSPYGETLVVGGPCALSLMVWFHCGVTLIREQELIKDYSMFVFMDQKCRTLLQKIEQHPLKKNF